MKHIDLFSGIGGFALAARNVGWTTVAFCEPDAYCQAVLRKHWPDVPIFDDVRTMNADAVGPVDIVTGGYPCQPFSLAGKRGGAGDDRHLWPAMFGIVEALRPSWVVGENVAGHITLGLDDVLSDLEGVGYACRTFVIPAVAVDARHRRERVWIVANDPQHGRRAGRAGRLDTGRSREPEQALPDVADTARHEQGRPEQRPERERAGPRGESEHAGCIWLPEPDVGRVAHGVPNRVDRLRALGNAIVPQVAEELFRAIEAAR